MLHLFGVPPDQGTTAFGAQKRSKESQSGLHHHGVDLGYSTTPLSTRWARLGLSGRLWTPPTDRAALASGSLSFLAGPFMGCAHRMCRLPTFAGNLALLFAAHRSEATASTFRCLHIFLLFLSLEDPGFDSHTSRKVFSSPTRLLPSRRIHQIVFYSPSWLAALSLPNNRQDKRGESRAFFRASTSAWSAAPSSILFAPALIPAVVAGDRRFAVVTVLFSVVYS